MIIVASCREFFRWLGWDKVWLGAANQNNHHDKNPFTPLSMNDVHGWRHATQIKAPAAAWKQHKLNAMNQNNLRIPDPDTGELREPAISPWALKHGRKTRRWGEKRVAGDKDRKEVFVCVFAPVSFGASPGLSADRLGAVSLHGFSRGRHRQTAAIKPWLFQVHRVWKGLIEGLWSQWGWSFSLPPSPSAPPSHWKVGGGGRRRRRRRRRIGEGGCRRHHVTHVSCWADQNGIWTKTRHLLLPASRNRRPMVPTQDSNTSLEMFRVPHFAALVELSSLVKIHLKILHLPFCKLSAIQSTKLNCIQPDWDLSPLWYGANKPDQPSPVAAEEDSRFLYGLFV